MTETSYSCLDALFLPHRLPHNDSREEKHHCVAGPTVSFETRKELTQRNRVAG